MKALLICLSFILIDESQQQYDYGSGIFTSNEMNYGYTPSQNYMGGESPEEIAVAQEQAAYAQQQAAYIQSYYQQAAAAQRRHPFNRRSNQRHNRRQKHRLNQRQKHQHQQQHQSQGKFQILCIV